MVINTANTAAMPKTVAMIHPIFVLDILAFGGGGDSGCVCGAVMAFPP
jgi:hypothetical protein